MGAAPGALKSSRSSPDNTLGPSPLGQAGVQYGFDDGKENSEQHKVNQQYLTLVYRNRRPSDTALVDIMLDPILSHIFRNYLYQHFKEALFNFWTECNSYTQIHAGNTETKKAAAAHIYATFLAPCASYASDFQLDGPTRDQITADLQVYKTQAGEYRVKQSSEKVLEDVFRFPAGKVFQILKFDYLSEFLMSSDFQDRIEEIQTAMKPSLQSQTSRVSRNKAGREELVDIESVIEQPSGMHYFLKFGRKNGLFGGQAQFIFDLLYEMNHYDATSDPATKMKRLKKIIQRYKDFSYLLEIPKLIKTAKAQNYKENEEEGPKRSILDSMRSEIMQLLDNYAVPFKLSEEYRVFKASKTETQSASTLKKVKKYATDRNIEPRNKVTFSQMINNRLGRAYFKNYADKNLMEESISFWLEIQALKSELKGFETKEGPKCDEEMAEVKTRVGERLITTYINEGSESQVNISDKQRATTLKLYDEFKDGKETILKVFEISEREILDLLKRNLWNGFRANKQFAYLSEKLLEKNARGKTNKFGVTTGSLLGQVRK